MPFSDDKLLVYRFCYILLKCPSTSFEREDGLENVCIFFLISTLPLFKLHSPPNVLIRLAEGTAGGSKQREEKKTTLPEDWSRISEINR